MYTFDGRRVVKDVFAVWLIWMLASKLPRIIDVVVACLRATAAASVQLPVNCNFNQVHASIA
jgi:hypothetical protein